MSDCGVCIYSDFDGSSEFFNVSIRKARKQHRCSECGKVILPGEMYASAVGKSDGDFWDDKSCAICDEIANAFYCDGRLYGGQMLWENMHEVMGSLTTSCFDKLETPEAKAELRRRWMQWKGIGR